MFIRTYYENKVIITDPVSILLSHLMNSESTLALINLNNFNKDILNDFISNELLIPLHEAYKLMVFISKKNNLNPFFVTETMRNLLE